MKQHHTIILLLVVICPFFINGFYNPKIANNAVMFWGLDVLTWIIIPLIGYIYLIKFVNLSNKEIGFEIPPKPENLLLIPSSFMITIILYYVYKSSYAFAQDFWPVNYFSASFSYQSVLPEAGLKKVLLGLHFSLTAGIVEEIYYRGVFRTLFGNSISHKVLYVISSSVIFSSVHWEGGVHNLYATFVFGVICSIYYLFHRNLIPLIVGHCFLDITYYAI